MRIIRNFSLALLLIYLLFTIDIDVLAKKKVIKVCEYLYANQLSVDNGTSLKVEIYDDYSHKAYITYAKGKKQNNKESVLNWSKDIRKTNFVAKEYYKKTNKCPDYALFKNKSFFEVWLGTREVVEQLQRLIKIEKTSLILTSLEYEYSEEEKSKYKDFIVKHTNVLEEKYNDIISSGCLEIKTDPVERINQNSLCNPKVEALQIYSGSADSEIESWVKLGLISTTDEEYIQFKNKYEETKKRLVEIENIRGGKETDEGRPGNVEVCGIMSNEMADKLKFYLDIIKYGGVILAIALGMIDFAKAVFSDEADAGKKASKNFIRRLIAAAIVFIVPLILQVFLNIIEIDGVDPDNPFCIRMD